MTVNVCAAVAVEAMFSVAAADAAGRVMLLAVAPAAAVALRPVRFTVSNPLTASPWVAFPATRTFVSVSVEPAAPLPVRFRPIPVFVSTAPVAGLSPTTTFARVSVPTAAVATTPSVAPVTDRSWMVTPSAETVIPAPAAGSIVTSAATPVSPSRVTAEDTVSDSA